MTGFSTFGLSAAVQAQLLNINFTTPTPIQEKAIPHALDGRDILGTAQTGTGKTAAFGLPLVHHLLSKPHSMALVMTPTRELAMQVMTQIKSFLPKDSGIKSALLIGGEAMFKQLNQLQQKPRIIIGTPGRINDHLERDTLRLSKTDFLVLDEADRMLDMGFGVQLEEIAKYLPEQRQTLMFSATVPPNIMRLAQNYLKDPVRVETETANHAAPKIRQELVHVNDDSKHDELVKLLDARSGQIIVFVKTKHGADRLARKLERDNHSATAIHGDLRQGQRDRVIKNFRKNEVRILVATDVAARGLDIPMLETVINFDLPQCPEDYIHRIGRTGRNGQEGEAICLISPSDRSKWSAIDRLMNPGKAREKSEGGYERPKNGRGGSSSSRGGPRKFGGGNRDGGSRNYGPKQSFGERKFGDRKEGGDKPSWKSSFKEKSPSSEGRSFDRDDRPKRSFGNRPARAEGDRSSSPRKEWLPEAEFRKQREAGNAGKPAFKSAGKFAGKKEGGFKKEWSNDAPKKEFKKFGGNKDGAPAKSFARDGAKKSFGDKPAFKKEGGFKSGGFKAGGNKSAPRKSRPAA